MIDHILDCKTSLSTFKRIQVTYSMLSDQNGIKLEFSKRKTCKNCKHLVSKYHFNPLVEEIENVKTMYQICDMLL